MEGEIPNVGGLHRPAVQRIDADFLPRPLGGLPVSLKRRWAGASLVPPYSSVYRKVVVFGCDWRGLWPASVILWRSSGIGTGGPKPPPVARRDLHQFRSSTRVRVSAAFSDEALGGAAESGSRERVGRLGLAFDAAV